jgi:hypothetical protein
MLLYNKMSSLSSSSSSSSSFSLPKLGAIMNDGTLLVVPGSGTVVVVVIVDYLVLALFVVALL